MINLIKDIPMFLFDFKSMHHSFIGYKNTIVENPKFYMAIMVYLKLLDLYH